MMEGILYERLSGERVRCRLCPHACELLAGESAGCGARENQGGVLYARSFGEASLLEARAVEWVPFFHFAPGQKALLVGSLGSSFVPSLIPPQCPVDAPTRWFDVHEIVDLAVGQGAPIVAAFGGEPFVWFEQWRALAEATRAEPALRAHVASTNGYASESAARAIAPLLEAVNLTVLGDAEAYADRGLDIAPVLRTGRLLRGAGCHLEVTLLVTRGAILSEARLSALADLLRESFAPAAVHLASPLHPETAAPVVAVRQAAQILADRLPSVYLVHSYANGPATTLCGCGTPLVERDADEVQVLLSDDGTCATCARPSSIRRLSELSSAR